MFIENLARLIMNREIEAELLFDYYKYSSSSFIGIINDLRLYIGQTLHPSKYSINGFILYGKEDKEKFLNFHHLDANKSQYKAIIDPIDFNPIISRVMLNRNSIIYEQIQLL